MVFVYLKFCDPHGFDYPYLKAMLDEAAAVGTARARTLPGTRIEVEAGSLAEVDAALAAGADVILHDNADPALAEVRARSDLP